MNKLQQASRLRDGCCLQDARLGSRVRALPQPAASRAAAFAASYCGGLQNPGCPAALQFVCWPVLSDGCHSSPPPALPRSSCRRPLPPSSAKATPQLNCPCCPPGRPNRAGAGPFSRPVPSTTCTHSQHAQLHPAIHCRPLTLPDLGRGVAARAAGALQHSRPHMAWVRSGRAMAAASGPA